MKNTSLQFYPLDNSAIIHLAAMSKEHTNSFRIAVTLIEKVCPYLLQAALEKIVPRFPTIAAGIRQGRFRHLVIPAQSAPTVTQDYGCLTCMSKKEVENCAFRVLYRENQISVEFFHSLTDGYGGMTFLNTLLAEYLYQMHGVSLSANTLLLNPSENVAEEELRDDYFTYAGTEKAALSHRRVYRLPGEQTVNHEVLTTTGTYDVQQLLDAAHSYGVSLTAFLTAVMTASILEIQHRHPEKRSAQRPIRVMVPVNLRKLFPSKTLRNFSLFVLPCVYPTDSVGSFEHLVHTIAKQLNESVTKENMSAIMATHTKLDRFFLFKAIPLSLKCVVLRAAQHLFGECNSCISLSNLGTVSIPKEMETYIARMEFLLTPRSRAPYNCGIVTLSGKLFISFSRVCAAPELVRIFFGQLAAMGCIANEFLNL